MLLWIVKERVTDFYKIGKSVKNLFLFELNTCRSGGDNRDRTGNLQLAKLALSQLSYVPDSLERSSFCPVPVVAHFVRSFGAGHSPLTKISVAVP